MSQPPQIETLQEWFAGSMFGLIGAFAAQRFMCWRNLKWTWATLPLGLGLVAVLNGVIDSWSIGLLIGGLITARGAYRLERRDRESGGDARRRAKQALGIRDLLKRREARRDLKNGVLISRQSYLLGHDLKGLPVHLRFRRSNGRHGLLLGASGAGKTNALLWCLARHIEAGFAAVLLDMKGDLGLIDQLRHQADKASRPFWCWTLDGGDPWNPLAYGNRSELKDKLIATEEFSERHYQAMYERYLMNVFRSLEGRPEERHLANVIRLLNPAAFAIDLRAVEDEPAAAEIGQYLNGLTTDQQKHLSGLADRLALLVEGPHGDQLMPAEDLDDEIDLAASLGAGSVVLFSLNSSRYGATAKLVGNMVIQELKSVCGLREADQFFAGPAVAAVDEFSGLNGDQIGGLFQRARSAGISLLLATQELADLRRVDEGFDEQIVGNVEYVLAGRQNNPDSAETVAAIAGTEEVWVHTFQTEDGARPRRAQFGRESGIGTKHRGREFCVPPDEIKALPVGRLLLIDKNPHRVTTVDVMPASAASAAYGGGGSVGRRT